MAWVEFRVVMISIIFMFILNFMVVAVIGDTAVDEYNQDVIIDEVTAEMGAVSGFITDALINIGIAMYSIFGVDFIILVAEVPAIILNGLILYNIIATVTFIFYLVRILWIGG